MIPLPYLRPFICRSTNNTAAYQRLALFNSIGRPRVVALIHTSVCLNTQVSCSFLQFHCNSLHLMRPIIELAVCKRIRPNIFDSKLCRCYSSFNVKSLWENEKTENQSEVQLEITDENANTVKYASYNQEEILNSGLEKMVRLTDYENIDWNNLKTSTLEINGSIDEENIDAIIMRKCCETKSFQLGKSFFGYLKSSGTKINRATYGNYVRLFYDCSTECKPNEDDLNEIFDIYKEIQNVYNILDSNTTEKLVLALSITKHWKEYVKLFKNIEQIYYPTSAAYSAVIRAAFKNGENELGWSLMEEMQIRGIHVSDDVFVCLLDTSPELTKDKVLGRMLEFMSKFNMKPSVNLSGIIKRTFEGISSNRRGTYTSVLRNGVCKHCKAELEPALVSTEDYEALKTAFLNPVLIGKDIFQKTKPEEFSDFLMFLEKTAPFDVVLDGLNIAFKNRKHNISTGTFALQLKSVVQHFVSKKNKVLVLGRKHMTKWRVQDMQYIYDNAHLFLADNMSHDDPFLLYATLYSGLGTRFVSQDMMRGHKFLLADTKLQTTFLRWQAQHQYFLNYINDNGSVSLRDPIPFVQNIQRNQAGDWHIPFDKKETLHTKSVVDNFHRHWLCLTNQPKLQVGFNTDRRLPKRYGRNF